MIEIITFITVLDSDVEDIIYAGDMDNTGLDVCGLLGDAFSPPDKPTVDDFPVELESVNRFRGICKLVDSQMTTLVTNFDMQ